MDGERRLDGCPLMEGDLGDHRCCCTDVDEYLVDEGFRCADADEYTDPSLLIAPEHR